MQVKAGQAQADWEAKGWIKEQDPRGWCACLCPSAEQHVPGQPASYESCAARLSWRENMQLAYITGSSAASQSRTSF